MESAATIDIQGASCAHCGLPVAPLAQGTPASGELFCCHACRLVAGIVGRHEQGEQSWHLLRLGLGALLAMNIMMVSLLLYTGSVEAHTVPLFRLFLLSLAIPTLVILLPPFVRGSDRILSLDLLIALGSLSAFSVSAVNTLRGSGEVFFDTATMLPLLVGVGKLIEASAKRRAADLLHTLETLLPTTALRVGPLGSGEVPLGALRPGDLVRVRAGERVAVDGIVLEGSSSIEESAFSGEFLPRSCAPGDRVIAGTVNGPGTLLVRAEKTGGELLLRRIAEMVREAWAIPSRSDRLAQRAAALFLPAVLIIAASSLVYWSLAGNAGQGMLSALAVLVVACPCTMGIATPLATSLAIARAARSGIVVRGGCVMEEIAAVDTVFFDKTGTLTHGTPVVQEVELLDPQVSEPELLGRLAALESASEHVLGRAIAARARETGVAEGAATQVAVVPGYGISGLVSWQGVTREVRSGNRAFMAVAGAPAPYSGKGDERTEVYVSWEGVVRGRVTLSDSTRSDAAKCVASLAALGVTCVILSGDRLATAAALAREVGVERVEAPRTPAEKLEVVSGAAAAGKRVAMVGDGINDAPALAAAHTGIALGKGMELAKQAGNVVIISGELSRIPWLVALGKETARIIRGNFAWSFAYNAVALAAAAAGILHPLLAALSMAASSLTVLANSLRMARFPDRTGYS